MTMIILTLEYLHLHFLDKKFFHFHWFNLFFIRPMKTFSERKRKREKRLNVAIDVSFNAKMWRELPVERASTPIEKHFSFTGPRTSTPKKIISKSSIDRRKKKKKKQKKKNQQTRSIDDYRLRFHEQNQQQNEHCLQIWFL